MNKINEKYDFECVNRITGEILNSNDEWSFKSTILNIKEEYDNIAIQVCGNGLYVIEQD